MIKSSLIALIFIAIPPACWAGTPELHADQNTGGGGHQGSVQFTPTGMSVVVQRGSNREGALPEKTDIDPVSTMQCTSSAGCTILVTSLVDLSRNTIVKMCTFVDGAKIGPSCPDQPTGFLISAQSALNVAQGPHTVQTKLLFGLDYADVYLLRWQIVYTLYDH